MTLIYRSSGIFEKNHCLRDATVALAISICNASDFEMLTGMLRLLIFLQTFVLQI